MSFKTKEQLFGDNGPNGPMVPVDYGPTPGYGPNTMAVGFGQMLEAATTNRICYALAENDEDLSFRLELFETGGLDRVYRLGVNDVPGGGRLINIDGGAVEGRTSLTTNLERDRANAAFRASTMDDTVDGSTGFDHEGRGSLLDPGGAAAFGFLDRRLLLFNSSYTSVAEVMSAVTRNPSNPGYDDELGLQGPYFFASGGDSDLIDRVDLIEVLDGASKGLYVYMQQGSGQCRTRNLDGTYPAHPSNTTVQIRLWRPVFVSAGGQGEDRPFAGVTLAGAPGESAGQGTSLLTLVPAGRAGTVSPASQGFGYALRTRVLGGGEYYPKFGASINAQGGFEAGYTGSLGDSELKSAGFRHTTDNEGSRVGVVVQNIANSFAYPTGRDPFYGVLVLERRDAEVSAVLRAQGVRLLDPGIPGTGVTQSTRRPAAGGFVHVHGTGDADKGIFQVLQADMVNGTTGEVDLTLGDLYTGEPVTWTPGATCTVHLLEGTQLGQRMIPGLTSSVGSANLYSRAEASIYGPVYPVPDDASPPGGEAHVCLFLGAQTGHVDSLLIRGVLRDDETFQVTAAGAVRAAGDLAAGGSATFGGSASVGGGLSVQDDANLGGDLNVDDDMVVGGSIQASKYSYSPPRTVVDHVLPMSAVILSSYSNPMGNWEMTTGIPRILEGTNGDTVRCDISGYIPANATIKKIKLRYHEDLAGGPALSYTQFQFGECNPLTGGQSWGHTTQLLATTTSAPGTVEIDLSAYNFVCSPTGTQYAMRVRWDNDIAGQCEIYAFMVSYTNPGDL